MPDFPIPAPYSPEAATLARMLAAKVAGDGSQPVGATLIEAVLAEMHGLLSGPRYVAEYLNVVHDDGEVYVVRDRLTGQEKERLTGYFAGQDARSYASVLNNEES